MKNCHVNPYDSHWETAWNRFNKQAGNGSFLFDRAYLSYHAGRFVEASIVICKGQEIVAIFPAHRVDDTIYSHRGLTYGGLVVSAGISTATYREVWQAVRAYYQQLGIVKMQIKSIPSIYTVGDQGNWEYELFQRGGRIVDASLFSYSIRETAHWNYARRSAYKKASQNGMLLYLSCDFTRFWNELLVPLLAEKYQNRPVHTAEEIELLAQQFPEHIQLALVEYEGELVAGTVLFCQPRCIKVQYIGSNAKGRSMAALDFLFGELLTHYHTEIPYWDWGSSHGQSTSEIQEGLLNWKASWGAYTQTQLTYELPLCNL